MNPRLLRRAGAIAVLLSAVGIAGCGAPHASTIEWSSQTVALRGKVQSTAATVAVAHSGTVAASWDANEYDGDGEGVQGTAVVPRDGKPLVRSGAQTAIRGPFALPDGSFVQLVGRHAKLDYGWRDLELETISGDGRRVSTAYLQGGGSVLAADMAVRPDGQLLVGWTQDLGAVPGTDPTGIPQRFRMVTRVAAGKGGSVGDAVIVDRSDVYGVEDPQLAVALSADRSLVVIAEESEDGQRVRAGTGGPMGPSALRTVASDQERIGSVAAAFTGQHAVVAWGSQHHGEEAESPYVVQTVWAADGARFGAPQVVDPGRVKWFPPSWRLALAPLPGGRAVLAWSQAGGFPGDGPDRSALRVATSTAAGRFGRSQRVARGAVGGIAARADGSAVLTAERVTFPEDGGEQRTTVLAALRPAGASSHFGLARPVATTRGNDYPPEPPAPVITEDGRIRLAWTSSNTGSGSTGLLIVSGKVNW